MNRNALKSYAPKARQNFIAAVTARAAKLGVTAKGADPVSLEGDFAIIGGTPFLKKVAAQRDLLERRIQARGFSQVMEAAAYTWFNRLAAIRYMEIHGYFDHGYRVLSHPTGEPTPEILQHADQVNLPGLRREKVIELKLDGQKDDDLYRLLLTAQCNALHAAMPFLFEKIDDETELLLPDNLLHTDSLVRQLISAIDEDDWRQIEIIGWLYQYYIADRHEEVIGKVVESEDIPAATQLFTPNWIVKYMVHNSLGAKWLATYPKSPLREKMEYYIAPATQTDEISLKLDEVTPTELDPETLTMIDPACGSGHIIVEGYDLFKEIYLERGYTLRQIPRLILERNLFGLDIDDRAAQLAGFALMMKARADDRGVLDPNNPPRINIVAIQETNDLDLDGVARLFGPEQSEIVPTNDLLPETISQLTLRGPTGSAANSTGVKELLACFADAKTFGSLITVSDKLVDKLASLGSQLSRLATGDLLKDSARAHAVGSLMPILNQARIIASKYDVVVANPPYMGIKNYNAVLKRFLKTNYKNADRDIYCAFIVKFRSLLKSNGYSSTIVLPNWMFHTKLSRFREDIFSSVDIHSFVDNGRGVFGSDFGSCSFTFANRRVSGFNSIFVALFDQRGSVSSEADIKAAFFSRPRQQIDVRKFDLIPGTPVAYWVTDSVLATFASGESMSDISIPKHGMSTSDNDRFMRLWFEVEKTRIEFTAETREEAVASGAKWFPFNKGGEFRKWYGNNDHVVNWENDGEEIKAHSNEKYPYLNGNLDYVLGGQSKFFTPGITWSSVTAGGMSMRMFPRGFTFGSTGQSLFPNRDECLFEQLAYLNSKPAAELMSLMCSTLHFNSGQIAKLPIPGTFNGADRIGQEAVELAKIDWDRRETSWDFVRHPLSTPVRGATLSAAFRNWETQCDDAVARLKVLEEGNNRNFIQALNLQDEMTAEVSDQDITLTRADREESAKSLISYGVGCMMGRYSLVEPGLVFAGGKPFDPSKYGSFSADGDAIIPVSDEDWFEDDVANRINEFLKRGWSPEADSENLKWLAESLGAKAGETPLDTVRRYLSRDFFKDHLQAYRNRPIYWMFSSGKEKAFECLVYIHRYSPGTLSRMRMEYVVPLQGRLRGKIEQVEAAIKDASTSAAQTKIRKVLEKLKKKQTELVKFDELLRHHADLRIEIDLDDGVKVNYGKFSGLLAEAKKIAGGADE